MSIGTSLAWARHMQKPQQPTPSDKGRLFIANNGAYINAPVEAYLECAWWADGECITNPSKDPTKAARAYALWVVERFCAWAVNNGHNLTDEGAPNFIHAEELGYNLWLSQQGHGTGFWDVNLPDSGYTHRLWDKATGESLHAEARTYNTAHVWVVGKYFNIE